MDDNGDNTMDRTLDDNGDGGLSGDQEAGDQEAGDPTPENKSITDHLTTTLTTELNGAIPVPEPVSPPSHTPNKEMNGGVPSLTQVSPTAINGENNNLLALYVSTHPVPTSGPPGFHFPGLTNVGRTPISDYPSFVPYQCDPSMATNWTAFPSESASESLKTDFLLENKEIHSGLKLSNGAQYY